MLRRYIARFVECEIRPCRQNLPISRGKFTTEVKQYPHDPPPSLRAHPHDRAPPRYFRNDSIAPFVYSGGVVRAKL